MPIDTIVVWYPEDGDSAIVGRVVKRTLLSCPSYELQHVILKHRNGTTQLFEKLIVPGHYRELEKCLVWQNGVKLIAMDGSLKAIVHY